MQRKWFVLILFLVFCMSIGPVSSVYSVDYLFENFEVEISGETGMVTEYVWRGMLLDKDPCTQNEIAFSAYGFTLGVWSSWELDSDDALDSDEIDYCLDYTYEFEKISTFIGIMYYDLPSADTFSREAYVGFSVDCFLYPTVTWYHDFGKESSGGGNGNYFLGEISYDFDLEFIKQIPVNLELKSHAGYNDELYLEGYGWDLGFGAVFTIPVKEHVDFKYFVDYSIPLNDLKDDNDGAYENEFIGGFKFVFNF